MQDKSLTKFRTAQEVADDFGVNKATINRLAKAHCLGTPMGATRTRYFTKREVEKLKQVCRFQKGNPNFQKKSI